MQNKYIKTKKQNQTEMCPAKCKIKNTKVYK